MARAGAGGNAKKGSPKITDLRHWVPRPICGHTLASCIVLFAIAIAIPSVPLAELNGGPGVAEEPLKMIPRRLSFINCCKSLLSRPKAVYSFFPTRFFFTQGGKFFGVPIFSLFFLLSTTATS
ncbi:hypothetical protein J3F84DRAFT_366185 [Trichoderma pleuroticola]